MRVLSKAIAGIAILSLLISCNSNDPYIAVVGNISGSNPTFGKQLQYGSEFYLSKLSENGTDIRFIDDGGTKKRARQIAIRLVADNNLVAVVGHSSSSTTKAAQEIYARFEIPLIAPVATYTGLTRKREGEQDTLAVRMVPSNSQQATLISRIVQKSGSGSLSNRPEVVIFYEDDEYGRDLLFELSDQLKQKDIVSTEYKVGGKDKSDITQLVSQQEELSSVIFLGYPNKAKDVIDSSLNVISNKNIILSDGSFSTDIFEEPLGLRSNNLYVTFVAPDWESENLSTKTNVKWREMRVRQLLKSSKDWVDSPENLGFTPFVIDALSIISDHRKAEPIAKKSSEIRDYISKAINQPEITQKGYFRDYKFTKNGETEKGLGYLFQVEGNTTDTYQFRQISINSINK